MLWWVEWRQRRMTFLVCVAWMVGAAVYAVAYNASHAFRAPVASLFASGLLYGLFVPIFLAMRTSLGETTDGTRAFGDALPVSVRNRAWVRLLGGAATLVVPIAVAAVLISVCLATGWVEQALPRGAPGPTYVDHLQRASLIASGAVGQCWEVAAVVACSSTTLYLVLCLLGTTLRVESHAGFAGAAGAAAWMLGYALPTSLKEAGIPWHDVLYGLLPQALIMNHSYGTTRGGYGDLYFEAPLLLPLAVNLVLQIALAAWFVHRYSVRQPQRVRAAGKPARPMVWQRFAWPLPTRSLALVWLTMRQALPMALPGLVIVCLMTPFQIGYAADSTVASRLVDAMPSSTWFVGIIWAAVVGSGIFAGELDAKLGDFWRAAPIRPGQLFAIKFIAGLIVVLLVLDATTIAVCWQSLRWGDYHSMNWPYIAVFLPLHATIYAIAVAWTCWLRRPVVGGIAAVCTFFVVNIGLDLSIVTRPFDPIEVYGNLALHGPMDFGMHGFPLVMTLMALTLVTAAWMGCRALGRYAPGKNSG